MQHYTAVFSDIDGTLLNSAHEIAPSTKEAIHALQSRGIPFTIVSSRSASCIYPLLKENNLHCPIIACGGAWIEDEEGNLLKNVGLDWQTAAAVIAFLEEKAFDLAWCIYSGPHWIVKDRSDARVTAEEALVGTVSSEGSIHSLPEDAIVNKILCICNPAQTLSVEENVKSHFPNLSVVKSASYLLEIMPADNNKALGIQTFCDQFGLSVSDAVTLGDNYNDLEMLQASGCGVLMGNAPKEILASWEGFITHDNDHDGICHALRELQLI